MPIIPVARFGSNICIFESVANAGAVKYNKKINSKDHATDLRAALTEGVVKYLIKICGREQVPNIIHKANEINFQDAIPPAATSECGVDRILRPANDSVAAVPKPCIFSSSLILSTAAP